MGKTVNLSEAVKNNPELSIDEILYDAKAAGVRIRMDNMIGKLDGEEKAITAPIASKPPTNMGNFARGAVLNSPMAEPLMKLVGSDADLQNLRGMREKALSTKAGSAGNILNDLILGFASSAATPEIKAVQGAGTLLKLLNGMEKGAVAGGSGMLPTAMTDLGKGNAADALKDIAYGSAAGGAIGTALPAIGEAAYKGGKSWLGSQMKITKPTAQKAYGKTLAEKKKGLLNTVVENDIYKDGDFAEMTAKANDMSRSIDKQSKALANEVTKSQEAGKLKKINGLRRIEEAKAENMNSADLGEVDDVERIFDKIIKDVNRRNLGGELTLNDAIKLKRSLVGNAFKKGVLRTEEGALKDNLKKDAVLRILDDIEKLSPQTRAYGRNQKQLIDAAQALDDAASRTANRDPVNLASSIILGGSLPVAGGLAAAGKFGSAASTIGGAMAQYAANKATQQGAGPRALINIGKKLGAGKEALPEVSKKAYAGSIIPKNAVPFMDERLVPTPEKFSTETLKKKGSIGDLLSNQRGEVAAYGNEEGLRKYIENARKFGSSESEDVLKDLYKAKERRKAGFGRGNEEDIVAGGYDGYSKSNRAINAEQRGLLNKTNASKELSDRLNISLKKANEILSKEKPDEWHHTSKFYNETNYYDVDRIIKKHQSGSALSPVLPATTGLSAAGLAAIQAINNMSNKGVSK